MMRLNRLLWREPHKGKWNHSSFHTHRYIHTQLIHHTSWWNPHQLSILIDLKMRLSLIKTFTHKIRRVKNYGISEETKNLKEENQAEKFEANSFHWNRRNSGNNIYASWIDVCIYSVKQEQMEQLENMEELLQNVLNHRIF